MNNYEILQKKNEKLVQTNRKLRTVYQLNQQYKESNQKLMARIKILQNEIIRQVKDNEQLQKTIENLNKIIDKLKNKI